ncbi:unnamed protein product [Durusdinium trenchii]|uniref:Uncharacterized protein n=1 Tax=Durusdinium trenchii TaxID=1381693 RepID=A0ABP0PGD1_9DINO
MPRFQDFVEEIVSDDEESNKANRAPVSSTCTPSVGSAPRVGQPVTQEVIALSTNVNRGNMSQEAFNQKLTHLQIQNKRIGDLEGLKLVPGVYVLYAYDNLISSLAGIQSLRRLQQLYLQNNRITTMAGLEGLSMLQKLHLGHNRLARIDSLESCTQLEELLVPHQQPPVEAPLQFCPASMAAISSTLVLLNTAGNRLKELQELLPLRRLTSLDLSENKIPQVGELKDLISGDCLRRINLLGNPFAAQERRYRTAVVLCSTAIEEIDGREVLPQERDFVRRLDEQKRKLNAQRKRHLNRVASDGRPRMPGTLPEKGTGRQLMGAEGETLGLQDLRL